MCTLPGSLFIGTEKTDLMHYGFQVWGLLSYEMIQEKQLWHAEEQQPVMLTPQLI